MLPLVPCYLGWASSTRTGGSVEKDNRQVNGDGRMHRNNEVVFCALYSRLRLFFACHAAQLLDSPTPDWLRATFSLLDQMPMHSLRLVMTMKHHFTRTTMVPHPCTLLKVGH